MVGKENRLALARNLESTDGQGPIVFWELGSRPARIEGSDIRASVEADGRKRGRWILAEWRLSRQLVAEGAQGQESKSVVRFPILLSSVAANT